MDNFLQVVKERLSPARFQHTVGVIQAAEQLAMRYGVPLERARLAALLHDYAREMAPAKLKLLALEAGVGDKFALDQPELLHAPVGALLVQRELGITDQEILGAINYHTVGRRKMNKLEQIIYLADMIEPNRNYPGVQDLRSAASTGLAQGLVAALEHTIRYLLEKKKPIDVRTIEARNYFITGGD